MTPTQLLGATGITSAVISTVAGYAQVRKHHALGGWLMVGNGALWFVTNLVLLFWR